jgi:hypothetical protein
LALFFPLTEKNGEKMKKTITFALAFLLLASLVTAGIVGYLAKVEVEASITQAVVFTDSSEDILSIDLEAIAGEDDEVDFQLDNNAPVNATIQFESSSIPGIAISYEYNGDIYTDGDNIDLAPGTGYDFTIVYDFNPGLDNGTYTIETEVVPVLS